jgi:diguanylate cyclase (GGDEF)-like protein
VVLGSVALYADITERKEVEMRVHSLAFYDQLTKLPNRTLFRSKLSYALAQGHRNTSKVAVLYIDLDRFKTINDSLGHKAGDLLLIEVAQRLQKSIRETDTVCRLGGDEFALVLTDLEDPTDAASIAEKIIKVLSSPIKLGKHDIFITPSIGISIYPIDSEDDENLLMYADVAMYASKREGKNRYNFYTSEMNTKVFERMLMDNSLRFALERNEFELYYQPKVNLVTGKIGSMEALVRWHHPEFGLISPAVFIPIAEETGLIESIGDWILRTACVQTKLWRDEGLGDLCIAVNLSVHQFRRKITDYVKLVLSETGLPATSLEIEITETSIMDSDSMVITMLQELRDLGISISIDDFGTGYSSLSRLSALPVDTLKIDQSFIRELKIGQNSEAIVKAIIAIAKSLELKVIAEGVETSEQADFLYKFGCHDIQGYLVSPPVPQDQFVQLLGKEYKHNSI